MDNNGIKFHPELIAELTADHQKLLAIFAELGKKAEARDAAGFKERLHRFKILLADHLLKEAIRLYIYLRQQFKGDEATHHTITSYKKEMDGIGAVAMRFIEDYGNRPAKDFDFAELQYQLKQIGDVLGDRIYREEHELYTLYRRFH